MRYRRKPTYYFNLYQAIDKSIEVVSLDGLGAGDFPVPFPKMKREVRNISFSLLLATIWLFQISFHVYHVLTEHTDTTVSSEIRPNVQNLDDGSLSCHLCALLNNHFPIYAQEIAVVVIISLMILLPINHPKRNFFLLLPDKVCLRGPPAFK